VALHIANATGQPAISLPLHWSEAGKPVGVHMTARMGEESTLLRIAAQLEQVQPWADRLPTVCPVVAGCRRLTGCRKFNPPEAKIL
jgi:hypothetical protein